MRIYISGPITGIPNYKEIFDKAEEKLKAEYSEAEIINPAMVVLPASCTHEDYMRIDLMLLDLADAIYLLKGWDKSKGACMEHEYAIAKDLIILKEESWEKDT